MHHGVRLHFCAGIGEIAVSKLQSDSLFLYCSFSPNDFINGANNFFSSCTRAV